MDKNTTISFIVPVYKKPPEVFRKCLDSLFKQSHKKIEVIASFDGENEELDAVCGEFPSVIKLIGAHRGAPAARNSGLRLATGEIVVFWDADCYIKPEAAERWLDEFKAVPDADFVYTGYEMAEGLGTFDSESYDLYSLQCGNFISTMSPIKREKAFEWDESIEAAQDWDYWLTADERGLKGVFIEGCAFVTDTVRSGLSSEKWNSDNRDDTIRKIRHKHGIPDRQIGVFSMNYRERAIKIAKIIGADLIKPTGLTPTVYSTVLNIGYGFMSRFEGFNEGTRKIQYWLPGEIAGLSEAKYSVVKETVRISKQVENWVGTDYEKNKLKELEIDSEPVPLPIAKEDVSKARTSLPESFTVLVATDDSYAELLKDLTIDLPHIKFVYNAAKIDDFSCFLSFYRFATVDNAMVIAHVNGRNVISNVQAPYCGFIDPDQDWESFKKDLYAAIREASQKPFNQKAKDYYLDLASPERFIQKFQQEAIV